MATAAITVIWVIAAAVVLTVSIVWLVTRRERYRTSVSPRHVPTSEVLVDPESGRRQRVYMDPATGRRAYVDEPQAPGGPSR